MFFTRLLEKSANSNASATTLQLLKKLKVPVTNSTVLNELENHPDYPSLYSISDSLNKWKVENVAVKVEPENVGELPTPFIAHTKNGGGNFVLVTNVNGTVEYLNENGRVKQKTKEEFLKQWNNVALFAEPAQNSGEQNYSAKRKKELVNVLRIPFIISACIVLIALNVLFNASSYRLWYGLIMMVKLAGCIVTGLLLWLEIDKNNAVLNQVCSGTKNINCTIILSSKASKLFNWISWSEIGFFYFAGSFLYLLSHPVLVEGSFLAWLNLFALPYTIFSIFYQWKIAKEWCPLCLLVQGLLIAESIIFYFGHWNNPDYHSINSHLELVEGSTIQLAFTSFLLPVFFWIATKKVYQTAHEAKRLRKELFQIKYNRDFFNSILLKQKKLTISTAGLGILIGNPKATNTIINVSNPYCTVCDLTHAAIEQILVKNRNLKIQIIFSASSDEDGHRSIIIKHFIAIAEKGDESRTRDALNQWYLSRKKNYELFAKKYPIDFDVDGLEKKKEAMVKWCKDVEIENTPTFFLNGYQLPKVFKIEDLNHLLM